MRAHPNSKELVEEALNNAEAERIEREEEIAEAKHQLELARMEAEKKRLEGSVSSFSIQQSRALWAKRVVLSLR